MGVRETGCLRRGAERKWLAGWLADRFPFCCVSDFGGIVAAGWNSALATGGVSLNVGE